MIRSDAKKRHLRSSVLEAVYGDHARHHITGAASNSLECKSRSPALALIHLNKRSGAPVGSAMLIDLRHGAVASAS